jgi:hypothetical protein
LYPLLGHERSEQWYDTSDLLVYYIWHLNCWYDSLMHKKPVSNSWFSFPFPYKNVYSPLGSVPLPSHLTSCTPVKSNLYLDSSLETVIWEPVLYKRLTFHNPNCISILHCLGCLSKESVQVRGYMKLFVTNLFFRLKGC